MSKSVLTLLILFVAASLFAQPIAKPTKVGSPASVCAGCYGNNSAGEPNAGKPMYQFSGPLSAYIGRTVDASVTPDLQLVGMRTVRAGRFIRVAPSSRGTAPPRIYMGMGETLGVYSLDTFFTSTLAAPMVPINSVSTGFSYGSGRNGFPFETIAPWDAFFYPEKTTTAPKWQVPTADNQDRLWDADFDDRGNIYVAEDEFSWGILKDNGETSGAHLSGTQVNNHKLEDDPPLIVDPYGIAVSVIFSVKSRSKYYVFVSDIRTKSKGVTAYDVTNTAAPVLYPPTSSKPGQRFGAAYHVKQWTKNDAAGVVAVLNGDGKIRIWSYDNYVDDTTPKAVIDAPSGSGLVDMAFDDKGTLWITSTKALLKATPSGNSYASATVTTYPDSSFTADVMHANAGYVAVSGQFQSGPQLYRTMYLYKMEGSGVRILDTDDFFTKFYHRAPAGYAEPGIYADSSGAIEIVKHGTKTYLIYNTWGIGDVFQLEGSGPSVSATMKSTFGTSNPNARPTQTGPFPGDPVSFRATTTAATAMNVTWNFGNPESLTKNVQAGTTGVDIVHQFTGLNTTGKITPVKTVSVASADDSSVNDSLNVTVKVPVAQIAVKGGDLITASGFQVVPGDKFVDASDGSVESHYATWRVGPASAAIVPVTATPDTEIPVAAALGTHTVEFSGHYGTYDNTFNNPTAYVATLSPRSYTVLPFLAKINAPTRVGTTVTYSAAPRFATDTQFLSATQWTYKWSLTNAAGTETAVNTGAANVGQIPNFSFATNLRTDGSKVTLTLTVGAGTVPVPAFETFSTFVNITVPNPVIQMTNCGNVGNDCTLTATAASGSTEGWQLTWEVKRGDVVVKTGTGNPLAAFRLLDAGSYTAKVTETTFDVSVTQGFTVAAALCGPPPTAFEMSVNVSCLGNCQTNEEITFSAQPFHYDIQACDQFTWSFGDGGTATGRTATHTYTSAKTYSVRLTIKNTNNPTGVFFDQGVTVAGPVPLCTAPPTTITFTKNCEDNVTCKAGSTMRFFPSRGSAGALQSCDDVSWDFGDGTNSGTSSPNKTYGAAGTYTVKMTITNTAGTRSTSQVVVVAPGTVACSGSANESNVSLGYTGATSSCSSTSSSACSANEVITFTGQFFRYTEQTCDRFEWIWGDGTPNSTSRQATHTYAANGNYTGSYRVYNSTNTTGVTVPFTVRVGNDVPVVPAPELAFQSPVTAAAKGTAVTFTVAVTNEVDATGWSWDFGDTTKDTTSQATLVARTATITHTFTKTGTFSVSVKARNSADTRGTAAPTGTTAIIPGVVVTDTPEFEYLLPVVAHSPGLNNSVWRTDVQIYNPDPTVSLQNPMVMHATLRDINRTLEVFNSTYTYEDFMKVFTNASDSGPVKIKVRSQYAPQIWTRTYNQTDTGTFGQFIPAIRIDANAGGGSAFGTGKYYIAGLRHNERFRTNLGFLNPNAQTINAIVKVYDDTRLLIGQFNLSLPPFQLDQFPITAAKAVPNLPPARPFSVQVEVPPGQWLIAYASGIDNGSGDPVYISAVRESELADANNIVLPGVGHAGEWRSDVTVFNPDVDSVVVDLAYHDQTGAKVGEAKNVQIRSGEFLQYTDLLKQGVFGNLPDSIGILRVNVVGQFPPVAYPLTFARTYNDKGTGKTFGQGIGGFPVARANVKPGKGALVPGIRSNSKYYTNVGLVNVSTTNASATVKLLDPTSGAEQVLQTHNLAPNQSVVSRITLPSALETGSLKIEVTGANIWAFCSVVDIGTADPEYVAASPLP